ncbi:MAG TPA: FkbM family methyltransferase [Puia sp.]|nr:FkbM family methyltransferase [Puia sp.]
MMREFLRISRFISQHPLASKKKMYAYKRFIGWQLSQRLVNHPVLYPFVENSFLLIEKGMAGATGNIYTGLLEFNDMAFVMHVLRNGDLFADIGANIGAYTILASGNAGARTVAVEPIPSTFARLKRNVVLNEMNDLVDLQLCGVGETPGVLRFTATDDTVNHVMSENEQRNGGSFVEVQIRKLDEIFKDEVPTVMKMDIEGFEFPALRGGTQTLSSPVLKALIIELNGSGARYGYDDRQILELMSDHGFKPFQYDPFTRKLKPITEFEHANVLYLKDLDWVTDRCEKARKFSIFQQDV